MKKEEKKKVIKLRERDTINIPTSVMSLDKLTNSTSKFLSFESFSYSLENSQANRNMAIEYIADTFERNQDHSEHTLTVNDKELNSMLSDYTTGGLLYSYPYILEIFGKSSIGKTQIMIQLLLSTLLANNIPSAKALYLSTEDSVKIIYRRFIQMFKLEFSSLNDDEEEMLLNRINFLYSSNLINFVHYNLETILNNNHGIRYFFIDSISNDLRHISDNNIKNELFRKLTELSFKYKFMIIVTNQVFTYINENDDTINSKLAKSSKIDEMRYGTQLIDCTTYENQIRHIANPLFHNRESLGRNNDTYETSHGFELPTLGYLFNNFVNTRLVLFNMGRSGERFIRVMYSDSFCNSGFIGDTGVQLKYTLEKNALVKFERE